MPTINLKNRRIWFKDLLKLYPRIAICGGPKSGKTTLSRLAQRSRTVFHSDDFRQPDWDEDAWSNASKKLADAVNAHQGKCVVEGVAVPRALRKGMKVDAVLWLDEDCQDLKPGQKSMKKACFTVLAEWRANHKDIPVFQAPPPAMFHGDEPADFDDDSAA